MQTTIIAIFCYVDDFLKAISWRDDPQCRIILAEIVTVAPTASRYFAGNFESARSFLIEHHYVPHIGKSPLNRRLHAIPPFFWHLIVAYLVAKQNPDCSHFLLDSFPIAVCHPVRSPRRALFQGKKHIGYNASKKMWFTGLKVHVLGTFQGQPKEFFVSPASMHDLRAFQKMYTEMVSSGNHPKRLNCFGR